MLQLPETQNAIAASIDGNGRRVACDPYRGAIEAVLECAQNLACVGAEPLGLTNCLNFGNPEKPAVAWQLDRAVQGVADACEALSVPVVGGNVSLYNETDAGPIYPTPVIGLVGELPDPRKAGGLALADGDSIALVGPFSPSPAGSELMKQRGELEPGLPEIDLAAHVRALAFIRDQARAGDLAFHDISDGGLAAGLAEMAIAGGVGARCDLDALIRTRGSKPEVALFGEGPGGYLVAGPEERVRELQTGAKDVGVDAWVIGSAGGERLEISSEWMEPSVTVAEAQTAWLSLAERFAEPLPADL